MKFTDKRNVPGRSVRLWQDRANRWHWEYRSNSKAMAKSAESFASKQGCTNNAISVAHGMRKA
jgi:uncharacterized protein YegP (UPF0339 family)